MLRREIATLAQLRRSSPRGSSRHGSDAANHTPRYPASWISSAVVLVVAALLSGAGCGEDEGLAASQARDPGVQQTASRDQSDEVPSASGNAAPRILSVDF